MQYCIYIIIYRDVDFKFVDRRQRLCLLEDPSFAFKSYMSFLKLNHSVRCQENGTAITSPSTKCDTIRPQPQQGDNRIRSIKEGQICFKHNSSLNNPQSKSYLLRTYNGICKTCSGCWCTRQWQVILDS